NPYVLRYLKTTSVFQCHHGHRDRAERYHDRGPLTAVERLKRAYYSPAARIVEWKLEQDQARNIAAARLVLSNSRFSQKLLRASYQVASEVVYPGINVNVFRPRG